MRSPSRDRRRFIAGLAEDRGSATAELAVALPAVVLVLALGLGALVAAAAAVRLQDAAADAARILARGDDPGRGSGLVAAAVPGAALHVEHRGDLVCVRADATSPRPMALPLTASACALAAGE